MTFRTASGIGAAAAAGSALIVYVATWFGFLTTSAAFWPFLLGTALVVVSGVASAHVMKPYYKVDRVLQIPRLKPFFTSREYKSIWAAFIFILAAFFISMLRLSAGSEASTTTLQVFTAGWFGFLYTDAMILLKAKFPSSTSAAMSDRADR